MFSFFKSKNNEERKAKEDKSTLDIVKELVVSINNDIEPKIIQPDVLLDSLGLDSIKFLNVLLSLEDLLDMELENFIEDIDLLEILTVNDLVDLIDKLRSKS